MLQPEPAIPPEVGQIEATAAPLLQFDHSCNRGVEEPSHLAEDPQPSAAAPEVAAKPLKPHMPRQPVRAKPAEVPGPKERFKARPSRFAPGSRPALAETRPQKRARLAAPPGKPDNGCLVRLVSSKHVQRIVS